MRKNLTILILVTGALLAVFYLTFYIHQRNSEYVLSQFQEKQLQIARQTAIQVDSYLQSRSHDLSRLASAIARLKFGSRGIAHDIQLSFEHLSMLGVERICLLNGNGTVTYSTAPDLKGDIFAASDFFLWARQPDNRNAVWIGYARGGGGHASATSKSPVMDHSGLLLVAPLYRDSAAGGKKPGETFAGALMFEIDVTQMLAGRLSLFKATMASQGLWIMDRDGTVILQTDHPEMVHKNIRKRDETCRQCHASFDHVETMLGKTEGVAEYQLIGKPNKGAAFASMTVGNLSWILVVNAPMDDVTAFVREDLKETLLLLGLLLLVLGIAFVLAYRNYREKTDHETAINALLAASLENLALEEQLTRMFEIVINLPWLKVESRGCILLVKEKPDALIMTVRKGLDPSLAAQCAEVPFGRCLCGRAALTGEIAYAGHIDERHETMKENAPPHGHYCVPIQLHGKVLGVLNLYLRAGHRRDKREEEFLKAIADVIAGTIDRKRAEEAIRKSEAKFHSIVEHATVGIYQATAAGRYLLMNQAFVDMLGYASQDEGMEKISDIDHQIYVHPEKRMELLKIAEAQGVVKGFETEFFRKDGGRFWVSIQMQTVRDDKGELLYYQGICEDMTEKKQIETERLQNVDRLRQALGGTVRAVAAMGETRDPYTAGHQRRVADLARTIATHMKLDSDRIEGLRIAATIHDLGKIVVPAEILSKPTKLTDLEFRLIQNHVQAGHDILKDIPFAWPVARMVLEHHERRNGSGYPKGLTGDELLLESHIIAVADVVEAMASDRPYRPGLGIDTALDEIAKNKGILYEPGVVEICVWLFKEKGYRMVS